jgi:cell division transport system ATP-binding protein
MIRFNNVHMQYQTGHLALKNINLHIEQGAMAFIAGRSGAGKSSLLRLIALIERHNRGQIIINGQNLERVRNSRIPYYRRNIGLVFQDHRLLNDRTIFDNVALPLIIAGHGHTEIRKRVSAALDKVGLLKKASSSPMTLSGGEQQRVGIARAVVHRPLLLLADEPTGNLDPALSLETMKLFEQFNQVGVTVLIASHDMDMIKKMRKRIITLREGRIPSHFGNAPVEQNEELPLNKDRQ